MAHDTETRARSAYGQGDKSPSVSRVKAVFLEQLATGAVREQGDDTLPVYEQRYAWFLGPAFGLLFLTMILGDGSRRQPIRSTMVLY